METLTLAGLDLVARTDDDLISVRPFALSERPGLLRCLYVFVPTITAPTGWSVRYRMTGLWDVLRADGRTA